MQMLMQKKIANNNNMLIYVTQSLLLRLCQQPDSSSIATCYLEIQKINFKTQEHFQELKKEQSKTALSSTSGVFSRLIS